MTNVGALSGILTTLVERNRGFGAAFPIPLGFLIISTLVFLSCIRRYSKQSFEPPLRPMQSLKWRSAI